jgi:hypothetical protein
MAIPISVKVVISFSLIGPIWNIFQFMFLPSLSIDSTIKANIVQYARRSIAHVGNSIRAIIMVLIYKDIYE